MHKIYDFVCKEIKELEAKIDKGLSSTEFEYLNKLLEMKKNILKIEMLDIEGYSADEMGARSYDNRSYDRGRSMRRSRGSRSFRRDGYSMDNADIIDQLEDMEDSAPDEMTRREIAKLIRKMSDA